MLADAPAPERDGFLKGLAWIDTRSRTLFGKDVVSATAAQQTDLLTKLSATPSREDRAGIDFFAAIKSMTITGYYTSEIGLHQELGDDGVLAQATFVGCTHTEHQILILVGSGVQGFMGFRVHRVQGVHAFKALSLGHEPGNP